MSGIEQAKAELEKESIILSGSEATPEKLIELTRRMFSKGYGDVEIIGKVADVQIGFINLLETGGAADYRELSNDLKLSLSNVDYVIENGVLADMATIQASNLQAMDGLNEWVRAESDYFNLNNEETTSPLKQIKALISAARSIAESLHGADKLQFILRPTALHESLMRALMEARGANQSRFKAGSN